MDTINIEDELKFVDPQQIELKLNSFGDLELHLPDGTVHNPVVPSRSFPLTDVTHYIAIQTDGKEREEICLIEDMEQLTGESR